MGGQGVVEGLGREVEGLRGQAWMAYHASLLTQTQVVQEKKMFFHGFPNVINTLPHCLIVDLKSEEKKLLKQFVQSNIIGYDHYLKKEKDKILKILDFL